MTTAIEGIKYLRKFGKYNKIIEYMENTYLTVRVNKEIQYIKIVNRKATKLPKLSE